MLLVMVALIFSQPLGLSLQKYITTDGDPADLEVISITRSTMHNPAQQQPADRPSRHNDLELMHEVRRGDVRNFDSR